MHDPKDPFSTLGVYVSVLLLISLLLLTVLFGLSGCQTEQPRHRPDEFLGLSRAHEELQKEFMDRKINLEQYSVLMEDLLDRAEIRDDEIGKRLGLAK